MKCNSIDPLLRREDPMIDSPSVNWEGNPLGDFSSESALLLLLLLKLRILEGGKEGKSGQNLLMT